MLSPVYLFILFGASVPNFSIEGYPSWVLVEISELFELIICLLLEAVIFGNLSVIEFSKVEALLSLGMYVWF